MKAILGMIRNFIAPFFLGILFFLAAIFNYIELWFLVTAFALLMLLTGIALWLIPFKRFEIKWSSQTGEAANQNSIFTVKLPRRFMAGKLGLTFQIADEEFFYEISTMPNATYDADFSRIQRGIYEITQVTLEAWDWLGIFKRQRNLVCSEIVVRLPKMLPQVWHNVQLKQRQLPPFKRFRMIENSPELSHLRDYATGDAYRQIHWKISRKRQILTVKEYQPDFQNKVIYLFLGVSAPNYEAFLALFYTAQRTIPQGTFYLVGELAGKRVLLKNPQPLDYAKISALTSDTVAISSGVLPPFTGFKIYLFGVMPEKITEIPALEPLLERNQVLLIWQNAAGWQLSTEGYHQQLTDEFKGGAEGV